MRNLRKSVDNCEKPRYNNVEICVFYEFLFNYKGVIKMDKLLFSSKGVKSSARIMPIIVGLFLTIASIPLFSFAIKLGDSYWLTSKEEKQIALFLILGFVALVDGLLNILGGILLGKNEINVYDTHIRGVSVELIFSLPIQKSFNLKYSQIDNVQLLGNATQSVGIIIYAGSQKYTIKTSKDPNQLLSTINNMIDAQKNI